MLVILKPRPAKRSSLESDPPAFATLSRGRDGPLREQRARTNFVARTRHAHHARCPITSCFGTSSTNHKSLFATRLPSRRIPRYSTPLPRDGSVIRLPCYRSTGHRTRENPRGVTDESVGGTGDTPIACVTTPPPILGHHAGTQEKASERRVYGRYGRATGLERRRERESDRGRRSTRETGSSEPAHLSPAPSAGAHPRKLT